MTGIDAIFPTSLIAAPLIDGPDCMSLAAADGTGPSGRGIRIGNPKWALRRYEKKPLTSSL